MSPIWMDAQNSHRISRSGHICRQATISGKRPGLRMLHEDKGLPAAETYELFHISEFTRWQMFRTVLTLRFVYSKQVSEQWRTHARRLEGGRQKGLYLFKYHRFSGGGNCWVCHKSGYLFQSKILSVCVDQTVWSFRESPHFRHALYHKFTDLFKWVQNDRSLFFTYCTITTNTAGVPNYLLQGWPNLLHEWAAYPKTQVTKSRNTKI